MKVPAPSVIQIRNSNAEDFDSIVQLLHQLYPEKSFDLVSLRNVYDFLLASNQWVLLSAICDQLVIGFGSLTLKRNLLWSETLIGYANDLVIDKSYRGQGIGAQILSRLANWAREQGCHRIELNSAFHRKYAHAFFEHQGFKSGAYFYSKSL